MNYSCLEELQLDLDLHMLDKTSVLSKAGCKYDNGWFVITNDGYCHLFDNNGNLDDIKKIKQLEEKHIRKDITKIIIPDSVISIKHSAFYSCSRLKHMTIPNSVMSIGATAFTRCSELVNVTIHDSVTSVGSGAFYDCTNLRNVTIGNGVRSIGQQAFQYCTNLTNVTIPNNVTCIGWGAFSHCTRLISVTILDSMISIGGYVFNACNALVNLTLKGKTLEQIKMMKNYPWGIMDESIIQVE